MSGFLHIRSRIGIVFQGSQMWFSELLTVPVTVAIVIIFSLITARIVMNTVTINHQMHEITRLESNRAQLEFTIGELKQKDRILSALERCVENRISENVIYHLTDLVFTSSRTYGYDPLLVISVIKQESVFNPLALGQKRSGEFSGALGLMQLKFETARDVAADLQIPLPSQEYLLKPEINVVIGVAYLARLINQFKSFKLGILAYNLGPNFVIESLKSGAPLPIHYYNNVLRIYYSLKNNMEIPGQ